jgi:hypothetical protein
MGSQSPRAPGLETIRRIVPAVAACIASAAVCAPALASSTRVAVSGDSVLATSVPSYGSATIEATRSDALTGAPVVIGLFSGTANPNAPFSVNTTTPTALNPGGDCWQQGALSQALTPDLQPGDTVTLTQAGLSGSASTTMSVPVHAAGSGASAGPINGCGGIAPWARNAIASGPSTVTDGPITVSGVAQPLATGVSVSATDGSRSTPAVSVTPASDGSWSATIPASRVATLADTALTVTPVMAVPDVSTGAQAHIAGVGVTVMKSSSPGATKPDQPGGTAGNPAPTPGSGQTGGRGPSPVHAQVTRLRVAATLTLARARRNGIAATFVVPTGARIVRVQLLHGRSRLFLETVRARTAGSTQKVVPRSNGLSRLLRAGGYVLAVQVGAGGSALGPVTTRSVRIR